MVLPLKKRIDGDAGDNVLVGVFDAENIIYGKAGNDRITGGQLSDVLVGEAGNDTIDGGLGKDGLWGGGGHDSLRGGAGNDRLVGDGGNDTLDGGTGADILEGGLGNDVYYIDDIGDRIIEAAGGGIDCVYATVSFTLGANFENLIVSGSSNTTLTGNALDNLINGNAGNNIIDGGAGNDLMAGGAGNDTYYVDGLGDTVTETANQGVDTIVTSLSTILGANIENLTLTGAGNIDADANDLDNTVTGTSGKNVIYGRNGNDAIDGMSGNDTLWGGEGRDRLTGGEGNDYLHGGAREDTVSSGDGNDTLFGGGENDVLSGGNGNDRIAGDGGNDIIRGGAGNDVMTGGQMDGAVPKGSNTFAWDRADVVTSAGASAGFDRITDFGLGDKLDLAGVFNNTHPALLAENIHVTDSASGTTISVNIGGGTFINVVQLTGIHETSLASFLSHYAIIV